MDYLWTPWRYNYITKAEPLTGCVFCNAAQSADDRENLIVHRAERNFVILNRFPYTNGHVMVVPYDHIGFLEQMPDATLVEMIRLARTAEHHLRTIYRPDGLNLGMNLGRSAGAGIADHVHMHVLPRWTGDTNFMTVTGETRVLPEDLPATWEKLSKAFAGQ
uniref:Histidine triad (HIT) protein n=1 Tax=Solibacter usitatus (strain Ellin6076) TaxID=234267 RepID=Q01YK3_SOLUE